MEDTILEQLQAITEALSHMATKDDISNLERRMNERLTTIEEKVTYTADVLEGTIKIVDKLEQNQRIG